MVPCVFNWRHCQVPIKVNDDAKRLRIFELHQTTGTVWGDEVALGPANSLLL